MNRDNYMVDLLNWQRKEEDGIITFSYPFREGSKGQQSYGFLIQDDTTADFIGWDGIFLVLEREGDLRSELKEELVISACLQEVSAHQRKERELTFRTFFLGSQQRVSFKVYFSEFSVELAKENIWNFVKSFSFSVPAGYRIVQADVRRGMQIYIDMPIKGQAAYSGESVCYKGLICNCTGEEIMVLAGQQFLGWESMKAKVLLEKKGEIVEAENGVLLEPYGMAEIWVQLRMGERMVAGGHEDTRIWVVSQGKERVMQSICLKTMKYLEHPFLYHDKEGWQAVKEKVAQDTNYQPVVQKLVDLFENWEVQMPEEGKPYCYPTQIEDAVMASAYLYSITGEEKYAKKIALFLSYFSNLDTGYPNRLRGCSQSYVQEGHFFSHLILAYDMIYDSGCMSIKEKKELEQCIRIYMNMLDNHIREGHISNWLLSEITGAVYGALVLGDMERAERFVFGNGGAVDQFRYGIFNDGWWHECSVGYNTWVSSLMLHIAHAMRPFGYNLVDAWFPIPYNDEVHSTWACGEFPYRFAMCNKKRGAYTKNYVRIKDMFDAVLPYLDYRGVMFGIADSDEKKLSDVHWGSTYDLAYFYYRDPAYIPVILRNGYHDIAFGMLPLDKKEADCPQSGTVCAYSDNIGIAMLRSQKEGRKPSEQIQAVLRYGSHGYAHGHFDIASLLSVMRYGRSLYNPENCWWGYAHFIYKFYVQCSLTKNMVTVDEKMQLPADSERILFYTGKRLQAAGIRTCAAWSYPPYGGMAYCGDTKEDLLERTKLNHCYLPVLTGEGSPEYGEISGQTEKVEQIRIMALTDDYIVLFDRLCGKEEHQFDCLFQIKGFQKISGESVQHLSHTPQMNTEPRSDAQFITDCNWYQVRGESKASFCTVFTEEDAKETLRCERSNYNVPGILHTDIYTAWPKESIQMTGKVALYKGWAADGTGYTIPLQYQVEVDENIAVQGGFDGWILGKEVHTVSLAGVNNLKIRVWNGNSTDELGNLVTTPQAIFLGYAEFEKKDGTIVRLDKMKYQSKNLDNGYGIGRDYQNGRVLIEGEEYLYAIPCAPLDHAEESEIVVSLEEEFLWFRFCIGVDAFPGDERNDRITYSIRTSGKTGRYITVMEPYETEHVIERVEGVGENEVRIYRKDGKVEGVLLIEGEMGYQIEYFEWTLKGKNVIEQAIG